jgi:hypothetical protein
MEFHGLDPRKILMMTRRMKPINPSTMIEMIEETIGGAPGRLRMNPNVPMSPSPNVKMIVPIQTISWTPKKIAFPIN